METISVIQTNEGITGNEMKNAINTAVVQLWDYASILKHANIEYEIAGPYLQAGQLRREQGWVLYLSVIKQQMASLLECILPELAEGKIPFKIPLNKEIHTIILEGGLGYNQVAKVIAIFPGDNETALAIAKLLIDITYQFKGPAIPAGIHLGNCVYTGFEWFVTTNREINKHPHTQALNELSPGITDGESWPFKSIASQKPVKNSKWLKRQYIHIYLLKNDVKGCVYKSLNFKSWLNIGWCLIKQGKSNQCSDDAGRTIRDRLKWQFEVQSKLAHLVPLPKALDLVEQNGDSFFIMEFIDGVSLHEKISEFQKGILWKYMEIESQMGLINYLLQVIEILNSFHEHGFIHRDLSPANFLVNAENKLVAIDIELSYDNHNNQPNPVFTLGTPGYMSPAQIRMEIPTVEDDIYGFGGLLIKTFTGLSPTKFAIEDTESLNRNLLYFIGNTRIAALICCCLSEDIKQRPTLNSIKHGLELSHSLLLTNKFTEAKTAIVHENSAALNPIIEHALKALWTTPIAGKDGKWYSKSIDDETIIANEFKSYSWYPGLHTGVSGVIYTLAIADKIGYDLDKNRNAFYFNLDLIRAYYTENALQSNPALFYGAAGFAVVMADLIRDGLIENNLININFISQLLSQKNKELNVANGIAGQGIAIMRCSERLKFTFLNNRLSQIATTLIKEQGNDGSWKIRKDEFAKEGVKHTGLFFGIAGIAYFLLEYSIRHHSQKAKKAAMLSLHWLLKERHLLSGNLVWPVNSKNLAIEPWLGYGFSGIAFLFIKAYELTLEQAYKEAATSALLCHPKYISSNYLSQAAGLSGLGEVYLEAYKVFKDNEWLERAGHIATFLMNTYIGQQDGSLFWLDGSDSLPTADFMTGNCGVIHFLLRYLHPSKINFPILSI